MQKRVILRDKSFLEVVWQQVAFLTAYIGDGKQALFHLFEHFRKV